MIKTYMRTIAWFANFFITLMVECIKLPKMKKLQKTMPAKEFSLMMDDIVAGWAMKQIKMSGARIHIDGLENVPKDIPVVFIANHQGNFDIAIFLGMIRKPKGYIAKVETLKIPFIPTWMRFINCVFIDRNDLKQSAKAILDGVKIIKDGHSMVIFPEGTRSKGKPPAEFKAGSFKLATIAKVPIVPVTIRDSYLLMENNKNKIVPNDVYVTIHEPIPTEGLTREELNELPDKVTKIIIDTLNLRK